MRWSTWSTCLFGFSTLAFQKDVVVLAAENSEAAGGIVVGHVRIQALSSSLLRVEPEGPRGFEDRTTFMVTNRSFASEPIWKVGESAGGTLLKTRHFEVLLRGTGALPPSVHAPAQSTDVQKAHRSFLHPFGAKVGNSTACDALCEEDLTCTAWVYAPSVEFWSNCWPLASFESTIFQGGRQVGCSTRGCSIMTRPSFLVQEFA